MISRRQIRAKVMQAVYACMSSGEEPEAVFDMLLKDVLNEVRELEKKKKLSGDTRLVISLFHDSVKNEELYDSYIQSKAENWELERIARLDRILMHMAISEMLHFEEIPVKVTINEYLELAKIYSTPKSSKFINGILDSLYNDFHKQGKIVKKGRGLITTSSRKPSPPPNKETPNSKSIKK